MSEFAKSIMDNFSDEEKKLIEEAKLAMQAWNVDTDEARVVSKSSVSEKERRDDLLQQNRFIRGAGFTLIKGSIPDQYFIYLGEKEPYKKVGIDTLKQ